MEPIKMLVLFGLINLLPLLAGMVGAIQAFDEEKSVGRGFRDRFFFAHGTQIIFALVGLAWFFLIWAVPKFLFSVYDLFVWIFS